MLTLDYCNYESPVHYLDSVLNLKELLKVLKEEGVSIAGEIEEFEYGKFAWILDNDGNKIELWEPIDKAFL